MIDRMIIEQIVTEVLKAINKPDLPLESKEDLIIIKGDSEIDPAKLARLEAKWNLLILETGTKSLPDSPAKVVFLDASQDLLVKGALGMADTPESLLLSQCILRNVPVTIIPCTTLERLLFDDANSLNEAYKALFIKYKEILNSFGAGIESFEKFICHMDGEQKGLKNPLSFHSKVLTHRDVQMFSNQIITIDKKTIVTPLARDTAREMGKTIEVIDD
jgi:hypothetical protein